MRARLACLLVAGACAWGATPPSMRGADELPVVPPEPGAQVLPEGRVVQVIVGDVDSDGRRELLRLVLDASAATSLEIWQQHGSAWSRRGQPVEVLAGNAGREPNPVYLHAPARLISWDDGTDEHVLLATVPRFEELDVGPACCLILRDVRIEAGAVHLISLGQPSYSADALLALDLDGDGRDELLATRSLPPLGDTSFPMEARVHRYDGEQFGPPDTVELPFGSGDTPFILGETDGQPGEEAGLIGTLGPPGLYRLRLGTGGALVMDQSQLRAATTAAAMPAGSDGSAMVVVEAGRTVLARWPAGAEPEVVATAPVGGRLVGVAETRLGARIVLRQEEPSRVHILGEDLRPAPGATFRESLAAAQLRAAGVHSYDGVLPGGGLDGGAAVIYGGRLVGALPDGASGPRDDVASIASLARAAPVGLAGDGGWMAILHGDLLLGEPDRNGGRLDEPKLQPGSWVSLVPLEHVLRPEPGASAIIAPPLSGSVPDRGQLLVGPDGLSIAIDAPPGSQVVPFGIDSSVSGQARRRPVPDSGRLGIDVLPPAEPAENPSFAPGVIVLTPAGHGHLASWQVQVLNAPPRLAVGSRTPLGSFDVEVSGRIRPLAEVAVDGRPVAVADNGSFRTTVAAPPWPIDIDVRAIDPVGNRSRAVISAVGLIDYRGLPWIPIVAILTLGAGLLLFLRAPRVGIASPVAGDDAMLEELDRDEQPS